MRGWSGRPRLAMHQGAAPADNDFRRETEAIELGTSECLAVNKIVCLCDL